MDLSILRDALQHGSRWVLDYFTRLPQLPVSSRLQPHELRQSFSPDFPIQGMPLADILQEVDEKIVPGLTHWNHPGFIAYFNSSTSEPAMLAEMLIAAINTNGMNWKSSPANTEISQLTLRWLADMLGLPHQGVLFDGGAVSSYHAILAMRNHFYGEHLLEKGFFQHRGPLPRIYLSDECHNSIDKALYAAGFGHDSLVRISTNEQFELDPQALERQILADEADDRYEPIAIMATLGTTSSTAIDPMEPIMAIAKGDGRQLWVHVDAAHGGTAALLPEFQAAYRGWELADTITVNPHKWMFVPIDTSVLFIKQPAIFRRAFSQEAAYLETDEDGLIDNYMDFGLTLGRRFRALKLFFVIKHLGLEGLQARLRQHLQLAHHIYNALEARPDMELLAPLRMSTVCFRALPPNSSTDLDEYNKALMDRINERGNFFLTHTRLREIFTLRIVISSYHMDRATVDRLLEELTLVKEQLDINIITYK